MRQIKIGDRLIGEGQPCFVIAEAGINHNGKLHLAKELVTKAAGAGADAVKFQTFKAESFCSRKSEYFKLFKSLEFGKDEWAQIVKLAQSSGITFLSTATDDESANLLNDLGVLAFKIASGDITHLPLLRHIAKKDKPIILSTGVSTIAEIDEALNSIYSAGGKDVILLHCVSNYPAKTGDVNLRAIALLEQIFNVPVGFSDHTIGTLIPPIAVSLGAKVIEKHFSLDKNLAGPDHKLSLDPVEFKEMVKNIRIAEQALGEGGKAPCKSELQTRDAIRRSIMAKENIWKGTVITRDMLKVVRPGTGIESKFIDILVGRPAKEDIQADEILTWGKV